MLLVDLDGVVANFNAKAWKRFREEGFEFDIDTLEEVRHYYLDDHLVDPQEGTRLREVVCEDGWFRDIEPMEGAIEGFRELFELHDVWICSKPLVGSRTCRDDKAAWLNEHWPDLHLEHRLILTPDKSMVRGDILLDDAPYPRHVERALWKPVLFDSIWHPHQEKYEGWPVWKWGDDPELLEKYR